MLVYEIILKKMYIKRDLLIINVHRLDMHMFLNKINTFKIDWLSNIHLLIHEYFESNKIEHLWTKLLLIIIHMCQANWV